MFAGMPINVWHIWQNLVEPIHLEAGQVLYETGAEVDHVYFPFTAIISLTRILNDGESIEVAMVPASIREFQVENRLGWHIP